MAVNGLPCVYVGRPTSWGNPFKVGDYVKWGDPDSNYRGAFQFAFTTTGEKYANDTYTKLETAEQAVEWYKEYLTRIPQVIAKRIGNLRGQNLACFCKLDAPCHADILLEIANK